MTRATMKDTATFRENGTADHSQQTPTPPKAWMFNPALWAQSAPTGKMAASSLQRLGAFNLEIARFMADRARKNAKLVATLSTCRSPHDAVETWREAAIEAVDDYASEVERLMDNQAALTHSVRVKHLA